MNLTKIPILKSFFNEITGDINKCDFFNILCQNLWNYSCFPDKTRDLEILFFLLAVPGILSDPNSPSAVRARSPNHWEFPTWNYSVMASMLGSLAAQCFVSKGSWSSPLPFTLPLLPSKHPHLSRHPAWGPTSLWDLCWDITLLLRLHFPKLPPAFGLFARGQLLSSCFSI